MKRILLFISLFAIMSIMCFDAQAQFDLKKQVFSNSNILKNAPDGSVRINDNREDVVNSAKNALGRDLTQEETDQIDDQIEKARDKINVLMNNISIEMTIKFISSKVLEYQSMAHFDEKGAKKDGIGWMERKMQKSNLKKFNVKGKFPYIVEGNMVIISPETEKPDTFRLNLNGTSLTGRLADGRYVTLMRK